METFAKLFERFLVFVYHCFDRIVIQGYLPLLTRPEHIVHFFRDVHGQYPTQNPHAKSGAGREQGGLRPASSATDGAAESTRGVLHLHEHRNGLKFGEMNSQTGLC